MKRLAIILTMIILLLGCASSQPSLDLQFGVIDEFMEEFTKSEPTSGWNPVNEFGTSWHFVNSDGQVLGACHQVKKAPEVWVGKVFFYLDDFGENGERPEGDFGSLCECAEWVEHYVYGGFYI